MEGVGFFLKPQCFLFLEIIEGSLHHQGRKPLAYVVAHRGLHAYHQGVDEVLVLEDLLLGDHLVGEVRFELVTLVTGGLLAGVYAVAPVHRDVVLPVSVVQVHGVHRRDTHTIAAH